jgi:hypothetical protein
MHPDAAGDKDKSGPFAGTSPKQFSQTSTTLGPFFRANFD